MGRIQDDSELERSLVTPAVLSAQFRDDGRTESSPVADFLDCAAAVLKDSKSYRREGRNEAAISRVDATGPTGRFGWWASPWGAYSPSLLVILPARVHAGRASRPHARASPASHVDGSLDGLDSPPGDALIGIVRRFGLGLAGRSLRADECRGSP
jgi:hypothetical protein